MVSGVSTEAPASVTNTAIRPQAELPITLTLDRSPSRPSCRLALLTMKIIASVISGT